jgi:hypothetical protein
MRWLALAMVVGGCSGMPEVTVSVGEIAVYTDVQLFVGRDELDEAITANGKLLILNPDGCKALADDVQLTIRGEGVQFSSRGGESLADTNVIPDCTHPQFTIPVQTVDGSLVLSDSASSATMRAALFGPRTIQVTSIARGEATLTWQPTTDRPSTGNISFVANGVTTPLAFSTAGSRITVDTRGLPAASGVLRVEAFAAQVVAERCDFQTCEVLIDQAIDLPVTLE